MMVLLADPLAYRSHLSTEQYGSTPLILAAEKGYQAICAALANRVANLNSADKVRAYSESIFKIAALVTLELRSSLRVVDVMYLVAWSCSNRFWCIVVQTCSVCG